MLVSFMPHALPSNMLCMFKNASSVVSQEFPFMRICSVMAQEFSTIIWRIIENSLEYLQ